MAEILYKVTAPDGRPVNGGTGQYSLPVDGTPGEWMPPHEVIPCKSGYHLVTIDQLINWIGETVWVAEGKGERVDHGDKIVFEQARLVRLTAWNTTKARLFAADCAEHVLHLFERQFPNDNRPRKAIEAARAAAANASAYAYAAYAYAAANAANAANASAANASASAAAAAANASASAAYAANASASAANAYAAANAANASAANAADAAAAAAAASAERTWQNERLTYYLNGGA